MPRDLCINFTNSNVKQISYKCKFLKLPFSVSKFIRIGIADKNDNPPYFDKSLYEAEVDENEDIQHTVLTVTANDKDECKFWNIFKIQCKVENILFFSGNNLMLKWFPNNWNHRTISTCYWPDWLKTDLSLEFALSAPLLRFSSGSSGRIRAF